MVLKDCDIIYITNGIWYNVQANLYARNNKISVLGYENATTMVYLDEWTTISFYTALKNATIDFDPAAIDIENIRSNILIRILIGISITLFLMIMSVVVMVTMWICLYCKKRKFKKEQYQLTTSHATTTGSGLQKIPKQPRLPNGIRREMTGSKIQISTETTGNVRDGVRVDLASGTRVQLPSDSQIHIPSGTRVEYLGSTDDVTPPSVSVPANDADADDDTITRPRYADFA